MIPARTDPLVGATLDGRYLVRARLARGGMSTVYLALDTRLDREVAVKAMLPHLAEDPALVARFEGEAKTAARLSHPHVVGVLDQGHADGPTGEVVAYLVMEYVPGCTLRRIVRDEAPLTARRALTLLLPVLDGLAAAHEAGLMHRDVKPENVLVGDDGRIRVADFGLSRATTSHTSGGQALVGTVAYLSPELVSGEEADARSDVYAAGIMLFELLTGRQPYTAGSPVQVAYEHIRSRVPAPTTVVPEVPDAVSDLVLWCTEPAPADRPEDAAQVAAEVRRLLAATPDSLLDRAPDSLLDGDGRSVGGGEESLENAAVVIEPAGAGHQPTSVVPYPSIPDDGPSPEPDGGPSRDSDDGPSPEPADRALPSGRVRQDDRPAGDGDLPAPVTHGERGERPEEREQAPSRPEPRHARGPAASSDQTRVLDRTVAGRLSADQPSRPPAVETTAAARPASTRQRRRAAQRPTVDVGRGNGRTLATGIAVTLLLTGMALLLGWTLGAGNVPFSGASATVPDLGGTDRETAVSRLHEAGLQVDVSSRHDEVYSAGAVVASAPAAGTQVRAGDRVELTVSSGPAPVLAPDLVGRDAADARLAAQDAGLLTRIKHTRHDREVPEGQVISQVPAPGATTSRNAVVRLTVSEGPRQVSVPDVTGLTVQEAQDRAAEAGLRLEVETTPGGGFFGLREPRIAEQQPAGGTELDEDSVFRARAF